MILRLCLHVPSTTPFFVLFKNRFNAVLRCGLNLTLKQECIPVGCIPPAHWSYLRISYPTHTPLGATTHGPPAATMHAPREQPCTPPRATMHAPRGQNCWHTLLKILPCPNFVAGGKDRMCRSQNGDVNVTCKQAFNFWQSTVILFRCRMSRWSELWLDDPRTLPQVRSHAACKRSCGTRHRDGGGSRWG